MSQTPTDSGIRRLADLPSPQGLPLLGNLLQLSPERLHLTLEQWSGELGSMYTIDLGMKRALVCCDPELAHTVLRDRPEGYRRYSPIESVIAEQHANGLFSIEGEAWRPQRKLVMQALAATHFRDFYPALQAITERLRQRWQRAADAGETVDMTVDLVRYTVDVTTALAFGEDPNTLEQSGDVIQDHLALIFPMLMSRINAPLPWWRYIKLPSDRRFDRSMKAVRAHIDGLIERSRARLVVQPGERPRNLLEAMLIASNEPGSGITDETIFANVITLLMAGEDTTAHSLSWTMYFLSAEPALQARLHEQAAALMGDALVCAQLDDLKRLDAFEALATEATRLKPIVPVFFQEALVDKVLGGVALPAGTPVFFVLRPAMLDEQRFGHASTYLPERWGDDRGAALAHDARAYVQFGAGPRVCPGRQLAGVEIQLVLSMLCRNFTMELATERESIKEVLAFTMMPSAMPVRLRSRR
jgi:cytochrome P450